VFAGAQESKMVRPGWARIAPGLSLPPLRPQGFEPLSLSPALENRGVKDPTGDASAADRDLCESAGEFGEGQGPRRSAEAGHFFGTATLPPDGAAALARVMAPCYMGCPRMLETLIQLEQLSKRYGSVRALDDVSFRVERGEIFGLLGPNGAGKTTLLEILLALRQPDGGHFKLFGLDGHFDMKPLRRRMGIVTQTVALPPRLTAHELLTLQSTLYESPLRPEKVLEQVGLQEKAHVQARMLSGGQMQKLAIALALIGDPELYILDEPTSALDPHARAAMWDFLLSNRSTNRTIVLSTHRMEEAEKLCTRVAVIDHGKVLAVDSPQALIDKYRAGLAVRFTTDAGVAFEGAEVTPHSSDPALVEVALRADRIETALEMLALARAARAFAIREMRIERATLEDVFMHLTGRPAQDVAW
jgi:ABC-2 type transport system ATP-binding protein